MSSNHNMKVSSKKYYQGLIVSCHVITLFFTLFFGNITGVWPLSFN